MSKITMKISKKFFLNLLIILFLITLQCTSTDSLDNRDKIGKFTANEIVCPDGPVLQGFDVSSLQPNVNWDLVASQGFSFAIIRVSDGLYEDPEYDYNWSEARRVGIIRSTYQYFRPNIDVNAQVNILLRRMGPLQPGDLPPAIDVETTGGQSPDTLATLIRQWFDLVEAGTGRKPMIYVSPAFWRERVGSIDVNGHPLWIAHWGVTCPDVPSPWNRWTFWQTTDHASVPGINGEADLDTFNGDIGDLLSLARGTPLLSQVSGNEAIALVNWPDTGTWPLDGHAEVFITTPSGDMMHLYSAGNGDDWTAPSKLDGGAKCGFAASYWPPPKNYPEIFTPWHETSTAHLWLASGEWNTFQDFGGGHLEHLSTVVWRDRRVEVFGLGQDGAIWHNWWVNDSTYWSGWQSLGGNFVTGAGAISWGDGHVEIFATDSSGKVWHNWTGDFPGGWHGWESIEGNIASRPVPVRWPDGHVEVFARGTDGLLYHSWYAGEPGWVTFVPESTGVRFEGEPSVAMNPEGAGTPAGPEIVVRGQDSKVLHTWWDGTSYRQFEPLGNQSTASDPFAWIRTDGTMEVFVIDPEGNLAHIRRSESKIWGEWKIIGSGLEPCVESQPPQPDLQPDVPAETTQPDSFEPSEITEVIEPAEDMLAEAFPEREPIESKSSCGCSIPSKNSNANSILPLLILLIFLTKTGNKTRK